MAVGLGEALRSLRAEITEAMQASQGEAVRFRIESIDMEFQVTASESKEAQGGVKFHLLTVGGKKASESENVHKVALRLSALTADGGDVLTSDTLDEAPR